MLFNTLDFIIFFIIVVSMIVAIKNRKFQHIFLLLASYFFFYYSSNYLVLLLIASTLLDFYVGKTIWKTTDKVKKKILLIISISGNLGLLGFFKYVDFAILQFNFLGEQFNLVNEIPLLNLALPIGISFYTFQTISYTVDIYRGNLKPSESLREFALFVAFFPQLVAGPIVRASEFLPQLREKIEVGGGNLKQIIIHNSNLKLGITMITLGLFKKMFIGDNLSLLLDQPILLEPNVESFTVILRTFVFGIKIYCDFSAYSDIAIGAAAIMGFKLPINFNKPYFATSPSDFWKRWHISLSSWLKDYLYIPLGGNKKSHTRTYLNLVVVMFLGGLWHGASWNFVIWGMLHGVYLAIHKIICNKFPQICNSKFFKSKIGKILAIFSTQYLVFFAWIPFSVKDTDIMFMYMQKYLFLDFMFEKTFSVIMGNKFPIGIMLLFVVLHVFSYKNGNIHQSVTNLKMPLWALFLFIISITIVLFYNWQPTNFIYFQF
jgi:alginate O-acetyltransferase complex protein AlgI